MDVIGDDGKDKVSFESLVEAVIIEAMHDHDNYKDGLEQVFGIYDTQEDIDVAVRDDYDVR